MNENIRKVIFITCVIVCLLPFMSAPFALLLGFLFSQFIPHPYKLVNSKFTKYLLQFSVVGLGFGMNLNEALKAGETGFVFTVASISTTLILGILVGKWLNIDKKITLLLSSGTAICGGSAIAAVSPVIQAEEKQMTISLGAVFILNSIALLIFPFIGHYFNLSQSQFGMWAAIAIHDTSSVVGAAHNYGEEALKIATTVKLERALWIIPLTLLLSLFYKNGNGKIKLPWFIFFYVIAMSINTYFPATHVANEWIILFARKGLTVTLFLIGSSLNREALKSVGLKPIVLAVSLWLFISVASLLVIMETV